MKNIENIEKQVLNMQEIAYKIINELKIIETWEKFGAKVNLVGSLKMGLLVKHRDIDFHIYTQDLNPNLALSIIDEFKKSPKVKDVKYIDLSDKEDCCLEFHLYIEGDDLQIWQIDMINIKSGSKYDGYFEKITDEILRQMTKEQKQIIWALKYETPEAEKICGMEYHKAVIQDNIKTFDEFLIWRKSHKFFGIIEW